MNNFVTCKLGELFIAKDTEELEVSLLSCGWYGSAGTCWLNPQQLEDLIEKLQDIHKELTNE